MGHVDYAQPSTIKEVHMKFQDATADGYKHITQTFGDQYIPSVKYIEFMAASMHKNIADWDFSLFLTNDGKPYVDKSMINKRFMEKLSDDAIKAPSIFKLTEEHARAVIELSSAHSMREKENLQAQLKQTSEHLKNLTISYQDYLGRYRGLANKIDAFVPQVETKFVSEIEKICSLGFFKWVGALNEHFIFETTSPVILSEVNQAAGINFKVNMGRFRVEVDPKNMFPRVFRAEGNMIIHDLYHPHLDSSGSICWGNLNEFFQRSAKAGELLVVMNCIRDLISTYNRGNPFIQLIRFHYLSEVFDMDKDRKYTQISPYIPNSKNWVSGRFDERFSTHLNRLIRESGGKISAPRDLEPFLADIMSGTEAAHKVKFMGDKLGKLETGQTVSNTPSINANPRLNSNGHPFSHSVTLENEDWDEEDPDSDETISMDLFGPVPDPENEMDEDTLLYETENGDGFYNADGEYL